MSKNKYKKILKFIAENRLGFHYIYRDTTFGVYGDSPTHIIITQTQGRNIEEIAKYDYSDDNNSIVDAIKDFKKEHVKEYILNAS
jgi:hypothetical protein